MNNDIYLKKPYFTAAYNHDSKCLEEYAALGVSEIWAGIYMPDDSHFGSGRFQNSDVDRLVTYEDLGRDFLKAKELGMNTTFLLNPGCSGNVEFTEGGIDEIKKIGEFLKKFKVDYITLAQPYLTKVFKKIAPEVKIKISSHYNVNSMGKFKFLFDDLESDIVIVSQFANKNFKLLKKVVKRWNPERLEIMCTVPCIMGCPMRNWHAQYYGHSTKIPSRDYLPPYVPCLAESHYNKNIAVSAMFVRREDIKYYQKIGINVFKIGERRDHSEDNINCVKYYTNNTDNYIPFFKKSTMLNKMDLSKMDGFYEKFFNEECDGTEYNCNDCDYCNEYADKVFPDWDKDIKELPFLPDKEYIDKVFLKKWLEKF